MSDRKGFALIVAIIVLLVFSVLGVVAMSIMSGENIAALRDYNSIRAFHLAEAGLRYTVAVTLAADSDWSDNNGFTKTMGAGTFTIVYTFRSKNRVIFQSTGTVGGINRTIGTGYTRGTGGGMPRQYTDYACYAGDTGSSGETTTWYNNTRLIGSFYFYGNVNIAGVRPPPCQTGGTIESLVINPLPAVGIPNYYAAWKAATPFEALAWDNSYYDNWLNVANRSAAATISLSGTENINLGGGTLYYRSVTMRDNSTITGPGTICATANPLGSGAVITYDNARFIGGPVRIIARGTLTSVRFNDNTSWTHTPEVIALDNLILDDDVVTPRGSILYSRSAGGASRGVQTNLDSVARGSILAPYGIVSNNNNATIEGLSYSYDYQAYNSSTHRGGCIFRHLGNFYNDCRLISDPTVLPPGLPPGLTSGAATSWEVDPWAEAF